MKTWKTMAAALDQIREDIKAAERDERDEHLRHIEELEHEVGHLKSVLRRIIGYVDSVRSVAGLEEHLGTNE